MFIISDIIGMAMYLMLLALNWYVAFMPSKKSINLLLVKTLQI